MDSDFNWPTIVDLFNRGDYSRATRLAKAILLENPKYYPALHILGAICQIRGEHQQALDYLDKALILSPNDGQIWSNRASALRSLGLLEAAQQSIKKALSLQPQFPAALLNQGNIFYDLGSYKDALSSYEAAITLNQSDPKSHSGKARSLQQLRNFDAALQAYSKALELNPRDPDLWVNHGIVLIELNRVTESLCSFERALTIDPLHHKAKHNQSIALLKLGQYQKAWPLYESRFAVQDNLVRRFTKITPLTERNQLPGSKVLIWCEQGFGDTFQFIRYLNLIGDHGAQPVLVPQTGMEELIKSSFPRYPLLNACDNLASFQYQIPLMSLPLIFMTSVDNIPAGSAYLKVQDELIDQWRQRLGCKDKPRIGLAWRGRATHPNDLRRSMTLTPLLSSIPEHFECISLQNQISEHERFEMERANRIKDYSGELVNFAQTAALIMNLDLVISVDTSVAHLAAALGKPVWILLPEVADWRWMLTGSFTPWYPSARLYRQDQRYEWNNVLEQIKKDLLKTIT